MAGIVQRVGQNLVRTHCPALISWKRFCSSDALMELGIKPGEVGMVSGIPEQQLKRRVIIYSPARTASQQGSGKVGKWKINFLSTHKWENPLMGWTSTGDPYANVGEAGLEFDSEEAAKAFAKKYGWEYQLSLMKSENIWSRSDIHLFSRLSHIICRQFQMEGPTED